MRNCLINVEEEISKLVSLNYESFLPCHQFYSYSRIYRVDFALYTSSKLASQYR